MTLHIVASEIAPEDLQVLFSYTPPQGPRHNRAIGAMNHTLRPIYNVLLRNRRPDAALSLGYPPRGVCFRTVLWSPNDHWPGLFGIDFPAVSGLKDVCFSPTMRWFADHVRSKFVVDRVAISRVPRVLFMARPTSQAGLGSMSSGGKERILANQNAIINTLQEESARYLGLRFEQSRCGKEIWGPQG